MTFFMQKALKYCSEKIYALLSKHSGKMLLATSIIGTVLSSAAQAGIIFVNDKYSRAQKTFMIPQEALECLLSIASIFVVTRPVQSITQKALKTGKILSRDLIAYLDKNNLLKKRGQLNFNIKDSIKNLIAETEKSDKFIKASVAERNELLAEHKASLQKYYEIEDSSMAYATTGAAAFTTAVVVPIVRNKAASYCQKWKMQDDEEMQKTLQKIYFNKLLFSYKPLF